MLRKQAIDPDESTYVVPSKAPDEVVSSWSVNPRVCMPSMVRTRNERLVVELRQRDRPSVYCVGKDCAALTKADVKS